LEQHLAMLTPKTCKFVVVPHKPGDHTASLISKEEIEEDLKISYDVATGDGTIETRNATKCSSMSDWLHCGKAGSIFTLNDKAYIKLHEDADLEDWKKYYTPPKK